MEDYKKLLTELYKVHEPERIKQIDYFLERYKGKEKQFYISQKAKYKSRKPVSDSRKIIEEALARIRSQSTEKKDAYESLDEHVDLHTDKPESEMKEETKPIAPPPREEEIPLEDPGFSKVPRKNLFESIDFENARREEKNVSKPYAEEKKTEPAKPQANTRKDFIAERAKAKESFWFNDTRKNSTSKDFELTSSKNFNKKYFLYIFGSVLLFIVIAVIAFFIFIYRPRTKQFNVVPEKSKISLFGKSTKKPAASPTTESTKPKSEPKTESKSGTLITDEKKPVETEATAKTTAKPISEKPVEAKKTEAQPAKTEKIIPVKNPESQTVKVEKPIEVKKETVAAVSKPVVEQRKENISSSLRLTNDSFSRPAYFVACYAVKTEEHALKKINELKNKGFEASYYWIPEIVPNGNAYFKVVIGPYKTFTEALRKLTPVQERAEFDAYVLQVK